MIVYSATKAEFNKDVILNQISDIIQKKLRDANIHGGEEAEYRAWQNSLSFMRNALDDDSIPNDVNIAIEYQIPRTSKRVDFMIVGADLNGRNNVVVVELKQWNKVEKIDNEMSHSVRAFTGGANRMVSHPSYQAFSYAVFIRNSSEQVQDENINIIPCAYLHNYEDQFLDQLNDEVYRPWYEEAPFFIKSQVLDLRKFIKKFIYKRSNDGDLLYKIDNGRIKPSKALQDCIVSLMKGRKEFILLDEQAVAFDVCVKTMNQCRKDLKKRTIIIQGGPGTGKSVLAINLLKHYIVKGLNASYVTKNSAPREAYLKLLSQSDLKKEVNIKQLFRSPFGLCNTPSNFYDCLIVDEAHRLVKQMYGDFKGVNQVMECINSSLLSIFLIDENQKITTKDIGSIDEIEHWAKELNSRIIINKDTILSSQFRCNGSDLYIQFINNVLQIGEYVDFDIKELNFDIKLFDDPNLLRDELRIKNKINNKARMVAGYCYDWNVKNKRDFYDIFLENDFKAKWNLAEDKIWAINPNSFEEVGCIHTAQGLEFDYVGVFIGKDLRFDENSGKIIIDKSKISKDDKTSGIRNCSEVLANQLIKNTYKTLLTRGQKGCYIYCEDKALLNHFRKILK
ncbi:MAG: DUF2075 domain-containing protein [Anaeroplasmataceae bacterium]|nr:DUF2075 domain-containing protein [Anaeroplasmataceae bacterium]